MKSLVCNVFGMAVGVSCLALILNRPSAADEENVAQEEKHVAIAVAVDGKEVSGDGKVKTITVTVKDGEVLINGKPVKVPALKALHKGEFQVEVSADAKTGEVKTDVKNAGDAGRKIARRMMMILDKDGETKSFDVDVDTHAAGVAVGKAYVVQGDGVVQETDTPDGTMQYQVTIVGDENAKDVEGAHKIALRAVNAKPGPGQPNVDVFTFVPSMSMPHALHVQARPAAKAHADVVKRLKGIESELKQIRKLLEAMQHEDADD